MRESPTVPAPEYEATRKRFQFSLRGLFVVLTCLAVLIAISTQVGLFAVPLVGVLGSCVAALIFRRAWLEWLVAAGAMFALVILFLPAIQNGGPSPSSHCKNNLKQLGLALQAYHEQYGCFPPAYVADENGRPMHSWRVLLLPYMEQNDLLKKYRFDEPWDGPNNRRLHGVSFSFLQCPSRSDRPRGTVDYLAVVGPGTAWPGGESLRLADITDDPAETILLVEVADSDVIWCEPRDLHISQMSPTINGDAGQGISSQHSTWAHVVTADGSVQSLSSGATPEVLRALLTPNGGETIEPRLWDRY